MYGLANGLMVIYQLGGNVSKAYRYLTAPGCTTKVEISQRSSGSRKHSLVFIVT